MLEPKKNTMSKLLDDPEKKVKEKKHTANGILATLWRVVLYNYKVTTEMFSKLLDSSLLLTCKSEEEAKNSKGGWNSRFSSDELTWATFITGLRTLGVKEIELSIKTTRYDGTEVVHTLHSDLLSEEYIDQLMVLMGNRLKSDDERRIEELRKSRQSSD